CARTGGGIYSWIDKAIDYW
nr:immunoglobulin heavy chain junction region [Macaca mulatta]MOW32146.1 immunoglobulin heavy chain junction region [Macaca mulatta]MOW32322.1 immunoglobulin heavy chain junction region [Macaca mulatta]MOW32417.1 immunoglobulin heavy chain junction region [Macaca mulatta]MOW32654.1 immunoglobulin heavy chain junction region [Macaca mulatta]